LVPNPKLPKKKVQRRNKFLRGLRIKNNALTLKLKGAIPGLIIQEV